MNCGQKMNEVVSKLENPDLFDLIPECKNDWTKDYAIIMVFLMEEEYRDYERVMDDLLYDIQASLKTKVTVVRGHEQKKTKSGYIMHLWPKSNGLSMEIELYNAAKV